MSERKIILGPPYSGTLYAYFHDCYQDERHEKSMGHPYYKNLYGMYSEATRDMALALCTIYDKAIIAAADANAPRRDVGIVVDDQFWDFRHRYKDEVEEYIHDKEIEILLSGLDDWGKFQLIEELLFCMNQSITLECPVFCGEGSRKIMNRMNTVKYKGTIKSASAKEKFLKEYLLLSGFVFDITDMDIFERVKNNKDIRDYSKKFASILDKKTSGDDVEFDMKILIQETLNKDGIRQNIKGGFNIASTVFSVGGFVPGVGTVSSAISLGATVGEKVVSKTTQNWYELAPQIERISKLELLKKNIF